MSGYKFALLPERDEILLRLQKVANTEHLHQRFYPKLIWILSGKQAQGPSLAWLFIFAIEDYVKEDSELSGMGMLMMCELALQWIDAIVDDPEVANTAKEIIEKKIAEIKGPEEE